MRRQAEALARRSATLTEVAAARARNEIIAIEEDDEGGTEEAQMRAEIAPPRRRRRRFARRLLSSEVERRTPRRPLTDWEVYDRVWEFLSTPIDRTLWRDMDLNIQA